MKRHYLLATSFFIFLFSCNQKQDKQEPAKTVSSQKITGIINTDSNAAPIVTLLTAANAPKVIVAGKPVVIQNPNADGLGDPDFTHYGTEQGLALENISCALLDKTGNLWFGSNGGGVSRYDGKKFTVYTAANGLDNGIYHMSQDSSGNFWFDVGDGVLYRYDGKRFAIYSSIDALRNNGVLCMYIDKKQNIWLGTLNGLLKYEMPKNNLPGKTTIYTSAQGLVNNYVHSIMEDKSGNFWFATGAGASHFDGIHFTNYTKVQGLIKNNITSIEEDLSGNTWFGTDSGISKFDGSHFTSYTTKQGLVNNYITVIKEDSFGTLWFGTDSGISKYEVPEKGKAVNFINLTKTNGLSDNTITNITEDRAGNIWFGTATAGVCKYNHNALSKYTTAHGLAGNFVRSIIQDKTGNLWIGTSDAGISRYDGQKFSNYTTAQGLPSNYVYSVLQDKEGNIWFGCYGFVSRFDGTHFFNYGAAQGIPNAEVWNMLEDKSGNLWFTSWFGVTKYDKKSFTRYTAAQGLVTNEMISVAQDKTGNMWFSGNGVSKFDGRHFTNYSAKQGLLLSEIPGLMADAEGDTWFGFYGTGISKFHNDYLTSYTTAQGIGDNTIFAIREDTVNHKIWFATNMGLSFLNTNPGSNADTIVFENFNYKTGFQIKDFAFNTSLFIDHKGVIWAGTNDKKLIRFDYNHLNRNKKPYQLIIENIAINNESICWNALKKKQEQDSLAIRNEMISSFGKSLSGKELNNMVEKYRGLNFDSISPFYLIPQNLILPYKMNDISFEFAAIDPAAGGQAKYQYMLEGYDKEWSPLTNETNANFGNINEGDYTFRLKALNASGVWSETSYQFKVLPPVYRTWWAYIIYALLFLTTLRIFSKWRERTLRAEKETLARKVEERTNELNGTLENLKSTQTQLIQSEKMASLGELTAGIAHEIQNPLNFVNNFSEVNKELLAEMKEEMEKGNTNEAKVIANDIIDNEEKINHHGKRADAIVKGMLQHSRTNTGQKESVSLNALTDEYLRLAYHGFRAKDKTFNVVLKTNFDENAGNVVVIPQDIGRVLLNIYNNAFYAVKEKSAYASASAGRYEPTISVSTRVVKHPSKGSGVLIGIKDNGAGISQKIVDKIFQPFFTTKPTGQGVGLGLSLSYDIIKTHGGELKVESVENEYTELFITLPAETKI